MMRNLFNKMQEGKSVSFVYFLVLAYTIVALVWWGILLFRQSEQIRRFEQQNLSLRVDSLAMPVEHQLELQRINKEEQMRSFKYVGEGIIFLGIILLGALFVYRAVWKYMKLSRQQQNFMMAVTHELKSPIAAAKLNLETIRKHKLDEEKQLKLINNTIRETNRLDQLCNNILLAAQLETHKYQLFKERLNFSELVETGIRELGARISTHTVTFSILPGVWVEGDKLTLQIILNNLVENAAKYAPRNTTINIRLFESDKQLKLQVNDEGPGIPGDEKQKIFLKFYRVGNENTRKAKGSGLGLFLTAKIVEQHGGTITVKDNAPTGTCFEITLPEYSVQTA
ncbi:sensor histidine kinase [Chitinophaga nivalis]|uniref:histidine kinase n=1 Tax=Chitinophaga nivalis TaxID=2991709 RepID=A0ABT3IV46_9BACT|nr:ATP-binding protein [Chitinophaga nivalis]MCW3462480.1 ATP-binding protein [Chitinophaga nivalis]MCW3487829.1 ATP-binding protein [Chitinophaga nivalis]